MTHFQPQFQAQSAPVRVCFGVGVRAEIEREMELLGCQRALVLSTPPQASGAMDMAAKLNGKAAGVFTKAAMHTPTHVTAEAVSHAVSVEADCLIALGGGSTTGLGKAIALKTDLPQIVIPTTYAGSEATAILGQTENGVKTTLTDPKVLPEVILYDADLVATLPVPMTVTSALNAMAHAAEALYAVNRNPVSTMLATEGLAAFKNALPKVIADPEDRDARGETLYGAWLCGTVLGQVGMALHHKLCHTLGGSFDLPHAETHAIVLPHALAYNARSVSAELQPICDIFGGTNAGASLHAFARSVGAPMALKDLGLQESDLDQAADLAVSKPYPNPRPVERGAIRSLLQAAWGGKEPVL
ncbi:MAG: maleylacetate reductase [Pseudomonadota bacterium]